MKARWRDKEFEIHTVGTSDGYIYDLSDVELLGNSDYWEKLKHQYAGMAMQGMVRTIGHDRMYPPDKIAIYAVACATALVEKLKND